MRRCAVMDKIDLQITNSVVCDASVGSIYKQIEPSLVVEHAFPLTGFVSETAHVTVLRICIYSNLFM